MTHPDRVEPSKQTILIVDDSKTLLEVVKVYLMGHQFEYVIASNGTEGLRMALREKPDLVISDVFMPDMTGIELCQSLRASRQHRTTPIILISSAWTPKLQTEARAAGASAQLSKPLKPEKLCSLVRALLNR